MLFRKSKRYFLLAIVLVLELSACCGGNGTNESNEGASEGCESERASGENTLNFLNSDQIPSMDSSMATDEYGFQFLGASMEGLYRLGEDEKPTEGIA